MEGVRIKGGEQTEDVVSKWSKTLARTKNQDKPEH